MDSKVPVVLLQVQLRTLTQSPMFYSVKEYARVLEEPTDQRISLQIVSFSIPNSVRSYKKTLCVVTENCHEIVHVT